VESEVVAVEPPRHEVVNVDHDASDDDPEPHPIDVVPEERKEPEPFSEESMPYLDPPSELNDDFDLLV
jgi:hypothetical protein